MVFNSVVSLKEEKSKTESAGKAASGTSSNANAQREAQAKREARLAIPKEDFFKKIEDYQGIFSKFDDAGMPTHDKGGEELTKSALKKVRRGVGWCEERKMRVSARSERRADKDACTWKYDVQRRRAKRGARAQRGVSSSDIP